MSRPVWLMVFSIAGLASILLSPRFAQAQGRLAVIVDVAQDPVLSDNLTEIAIARAAALGERELVGFEELRDRLSELAVIKTGGVDACAKDVACILELGQVANAQRAIIGNVAAHDEKFDCEVTLFDTATGKVLAKSARETAPSPQALIGLLEGLVQDTLLPTKPAKPIRLTTQAQPLRPAAPLESHMTLIPVSFRFGESVASFKPRYLAYTAAALGAVALGTACITGQVATGELQGATRADKQADFERRRDYAHVSNGLIVAGGALAVVSAATFVWHW
jgi:hypothetical protein